MTTCQFVYFNAMNKPQKERQSFMVCRSRIGIVKDGAFGVLVNFLPSAVLARLLPTCNNCLLVGLWNIDKNHGSVNCKLF